MSRVCHVYDCESPVLAKGACGRHYQQMRNRGAALPDREPPKAKPGQRVCSVDDCERPHKGHGLCGRCLQRKRKHGTTDPPKKRAYKTLSEDEVQRRCLTEGYEYLGGYTGFSEPFRARHIVCGAEVNATLQAIKDKRLIAGCGCLTIRRTNRLDELGYDLLDTWKDTEDGDRRYDLVHHRECRYEFVVMETSLLSGHISGPHPCNPSWLDPDEAMDKYRQAGGTPTEPYPGASNKPWPGMCNLCPDTHDIAPSWDSLKMGRGVCAKYGKRQLADALRTPPEVIRRILSEHRVSVPDHQLPSIGETNHNGVCTTCGDPIRTKPINLSKGIRSGCRCTPRAYGFNPKEDAYGYLLERKRGTETQRKYGICNIESTRLTTHERNEWTVIDRSPVRPGPTIQARERSIHQTLQAIDVRQKGIVEQFDGYTETYLVSNLPDGPDTFDELYNFAQHLMRFTD